MFCKNCGKELPENAKFCSACGTPVAAPASPAPQDPPVDREVPAEPVIPAEPAAPVEPVAPVIPDPAAEPPVLEDPAAAEPAVEEPPVLEDPAAGPWPGAPVDTPAAEGAAVAVAPVIAAAQEGGAADTSPIKRRGKSGLVVIAVAAVVVIALLALVIKAGMSLLGGGGGVAAYAYLNDDGELMYLADLKEKTTALELTDEAHEYRTSVRFSPDGKTVYFTDEDSTLYGITVAELKKGGKPERISRDVNFFSVLKDGRVVYTQYDNSENRLSVYEKGESFRLLKDYSGYQLSDDQKTVYYTELDESDNTYALYRKAMTRDAKEERLLKGATAIYSDWDAGTLVYGVDENEMNGYSTSISNSLTVYSCTPGGDKAKLVSDVYSIAGMTVDGGKVSFYYWVEDVNERTLYDMVTDTNAAADAATLAEEAPVYPRWQDYSPVNWWVEDAAGNVLYDFNTDKMSETYTYYYQDAWTYYYEDGMGNRYPIDFSELDPAYREINIIMNNFMANGGYLPGLDRDLAGERYEAAMEDYDARYDVWYAAQNREYIRQELKETQYNQTSYSLYHYTGSGKGDTIATGVNSYGRAGSGPDGIFLYHKVGEDGGKVADVADLGYTGEIYDYLSSGGSGDGDWYQNVGGKESVIDLDDVVSVYSIYVLNGKEVVLDVYDGYEESLLACSLGKDALTFSSTIAEGDDFSGPYRGKSAGKDVLYLFTDTEEEDYDTLGDFCVYKDGKLETIAKEVYDAIVLDESGAVYVVTDIDSRDQSVELAVMKDGKPVKISDEVSEREPVFLDGSQILYIADGDLMLWNGKENRQIARDVVKLWAGAQESYSTYNAY